MRNLKRALSLALASVMLLGMMVVGTSAASFPDVDSNDNIEAIDVLEMVQVMIGNENGEFEPDKNVTRAEMAVVMAKLLNLDYKYYETTCPFNDVPDWAKGWVGACAANGIVSGRGEGVYDPNASVTAVEAASMMMRALGYFQNSGDYEKGFEASTVAQASKISLFKGINGNARDPMNRNQVAQLALNTLEARMVEFTGDMGFEANGISIGYRSEYSYRTGTQSRYNAIREDGATSSVAGGTSQFYVQLGEQLYNGDLKKSLGRDNFGRLVNVWSYKSTEIGKYIDEDTVKGTWTVKVSEKDLYDSVGSAAYNNYTWEVWQNGGLIADGLAARRAVIANGITSSERVLTSGNGVLTEVFVSDSMERVVVSLIDTGVAKVVRVDEKDGQYEVSVSFRTRVSNGNKAQIAPDNKFVTPVKFERDDIVLYTASAGTNEIESMAVAEAVSGTVTTQKDNDYTVLGSDTYNYNFAYTKKLADNGVAEGLYNLEDGEGGKNPAINKEVTLYLDAYGNAVAYEGKVTTAEDYLFVTEVGKVFDSEPSAKVVFSDGTKATINVDEIIENGVHYDAVSGTPNTAKQKNVDENTIYKFTKNSNSYDLEVVAQSAGTGATIKKDDPTITADGTASGAVTNGNTVFVDVVNGKAQIGYRNISTKSEANVALVKNKNQVAEVVFIYGSFTEEAAADDFVVLSGTGYEQVVLDGKTVYRMKSAYDVNGVALDECYVASKSEADEAVKGLMRVSKRNGDEHISDWTKVLTAVGNVGLNAEYYATSASASLLKLNKSITFNNNPKSTFGYNSDTVFVVIDLNKGNTDVDRVRNGSIQDVEAQETGTGVDNTDMTGVYVMTIDDSSKAAPMAESVLVIVPNNGSAGSDAGNQGPSAGDDATKLGPTSSLTKINEALEKGDVKINGTLKPGNAALAGTIEIPANTTLEITGGLDASGSGASISFADKTSALVVGGTLTLKQDTIDGIVSAGSLVLKDTTTINADVTVTGDATCSETGKNVTIAKGVTVKIGGNFTGNASGTLTNYGHLEAAEGAVTGWQEVKELSGKTLIAKVIKVTTLTVGDATNTGRVQVSEAIQATTVTVTNGNVQTVAISDQAGTGAATTVTVTKGTLTATGAVSTATATVSANAQATVGTLTVSTKLALGESAKLTVNAKLDGAATNVEGAAGATVSFGASATTEGAIAEKFQNKTNGAASDEVGGKDFTWGKVDGETPSAPADSFVSDEDKTPAIKDLAVKVVDNAKDLVSFTTEKGVNGAASTTADILNKWTGTTDETTANTWLKDNPYVFIYWERAAGVTTEGKKADITIKCGETEFTDVLDSMGQFAANKNNRAHSYFLFKQGDATTGSGDTGVAGTKPAETKSFTITVTWNYAGATQTATDTYTYTVAPAAGG